jgi:hypothetical protein
MRNECLRQFGTLPPPPEKNRAVQMIWTVVFK